MDDTWDNAPGIKLTGLSSLERTAISRKAAEMMPRDAGSKSLGVIVTGLGMDLVELVAFLTKIQEELYGAPSY